MLEYVSDSVIIYEALWGQEKDLEVLLVLQLAWLFPLEFWLLAPERAKVT